ncbi:hypothetical protein L3X38_015287 [Prunus dulcis]|uniref:Retrotransposon gag domain-containing protein n=1 Tax=Prunus dulcis TaxID=3755 RepID=A0AAD4ZJ89_PRUDU|nr:hypothetical protein L3X38_015287 [Prunus dulcis]
MTTFSQKDTESLPQAWERFKDLITLCPHHGFERWRMRNLIFGALPTHLSLIPKAKSSINPSSGGIYHLKEEDSLKAQLATMAREVETLK